MKNILVIAGTRPEAVKMAPVVYELRRRSGEFGVHLCAAGQHRQMLEQTFADFGLTPDSSLDVMTGGQSLASLSARLFGAVDALLERLAPHAVLVQGDTTTVQVSALSAFYRRIPVGHVEAGLRTWDCRVPFPEEANRRIVGLVARWHYAPTGLARDNLLAERVRPQDILVTGNTVVDALLMTREAVRRDPPPLPARVEEALARHPVILVTGHRRESFGPGFERICAALAAIAAAAPRARIVYPVHLNPRVRSPVTALLGAIPNIFLEEPLPYRAFVRLMEGCSLILTDSGGIQEEGPSLGKPVLIMRDVTERPEGVEAGVNVLVGTDAENIRAQTLRLLDDPQAVALMAATRNPYGDGMAATRIADHLAAQNLPETA